ncbi:DNA sulfur modification protein DndB [Embleya sp. NPDC001921]
MGQIGFDTACVAEAPSTVPFELSTSPWSVPRGHTEPKAGGVRAIAAAVFVERTPSPDLHKRVDSGHDFLADPKRPGASFGAREPDSGQLSFYCQEFTISITVDPLRLSKPQDPSTYLAIRTVQGGRIVYTTRVPLLELPTILPVPDPGQRGQGQPQGRPPARQALRRVPRQQAGLDRPGPVGPRQRRLPVREGRRAGHRGLPHRSLGGISPLRTIDGQHRVLGVSIEKLRITEAIAGLDRELARRVSPEKGLKIEADRKRFVGRMERLKAEYVGLDIYVEPDPIKAQQMFVDVADNAKGISSAAGARFDSNKVANRTLSDVIDHPLLKGRVDPERDRMTLKNPNLMGAKHVADITRAVIAGPSGQIGKKAEQTLTDGEVIEKVEDFLDVISDAFADLAALTEDDLDEEPKVGDLTMSQRSRRTSLLGSVGMPRVLGGVFRELRSGDNPALLDDIAAFFKRLDPHMGAPIADSSIWRTSATGVDFEPNASAPIMRTQNIIHLVGVISGWYTRPPAAL